MTNRDYFRSTGESLDWCKCLSFADGSVQVAVLGGDIVSIVDNGSECCSPTADDIHRLAVRLNDFYDPHRGWDDTHMLLEVTQEELPCCECPWFDVCSIMDETPDCISAENPPCRECPWSDICDRAAEEADDADEEAD